MAYERRKCSTPDEIRAFQAAAGKLMARFAQDPTLPLTSWVINGDQNKDDLYVLLELFGILRPGNRATLEAEAKIWAQYLGTDVETSTSEVDRIACVSRTRFTVRAEYAGVKVIVHGGYEHPTAYDPQDPS